MADPKKPKQLSEADPLVDFTKTGNIYVDPSYTSEETTPATSPITGEALTFGENTLTTFSANNNNSPAIQPEDGHAIFVSNLKRNTARGNGNDYFFNSNIDTGETFFAETLDQHNANLALVESQYAAAKAAANGET